MTQLKVEIRKLITQSKEMNTIKGKELMREKEEIQSREKIFEQ